MNIVVLNSSSMGIIWKANSVGKGRIQFFFFYYYKNPFFLSGDKNNSVKNPRVVHLTR